MGIAEKLPSMTNQDLTSLRANAERLGQSGTPRQQEEAGRLLPLIDAEIQGRKRTTPASLSRARAGKR